MLTTALNSKKFDCFWAAVHYGADVNFENWGKDNKGILFSAIPMIGMSMLPGFQIFVGRSERAHV